MLRSRSDKLLTTMRKIDNQKSFLKAEDQKDFFLLPFNKEVQHKRTPFKKLSNNTIKTFSKKHYQNETKNNYNKENNKNVNLGKKSIKTPKESQVVSKISTNDLFDIGIISEIQARETFMLDTILQSAILNR